MLTLVIIQKRITTIITGTIYYQNDNHGAVTTALLFDIVNYYCLYLRYSTRLTRYNAINESTNNFPNVSKIRRKKKSH